MRISRKTLPDIKPQLPVQLPAPESFGLPEKILQFGTGVLLRGLPDHFVDQANKQGIFNGRVVMVKSTSHGDTTAFDEQDSLFTLCIRGLEDGKKREDYYLNNAVSRVVNARTDWESILELAASPDMEVVISNTTEVGIRLVEDDVKAAPPQSFPGKLLSFLYARYEAFEGDPEKGMVIVPTELLTDNGNKLKAILLELAEMNKLPDAFRDWLVRHNTFCNSLVDRIVPGSLPAAEAKAVEAKLGYDDELLISAEPYSLWAIETPSEKTGEVLSFAKNAPGIILSRDISTHRELKLRLLNGTHTFSCAVALLSGFETVGEAMRDTTFSKFTEGLMTEEISPTLAGERISKEDALVFTSRILDRFRNPFIVHQWLSIAVQYTFKMRMRNVPLLTTFAEKFQAVPQAMAKGLAAYMLFMRSEKQADGSFTGVFGDLHYTIQDEYAGLLWEKWDEQPEDPTAAILADTRLWDTDLSAVPGLVEATQDHLQQWMEHSPVLSR